MERLAGVLRRHGGLMRGVICVHRVLSFVARVRERLHTYDIVHAAVLSIEYRVLRVIGNIALLI